MSFVTYSRAAHHPGIGADSAADRLAELRCTSHGGRYIGAGLCDYTGECAEQGMDWEGGVEPSGRPICVRPEPPPSSGRPPPSMPDAPATAIALPLVLAIGGVVLLLRRRKRS